MKNKFTVLLSVLTVVGLIVIFIWMHELKDSKKKQQEIENGNKEVV